MIRENGNNEIRGFGKPNHEDISRKACAIWQQMGRPKGMDQEIWKKAESSLNPNSQDPTPEQSQSASQNTSNPSQKSAQSAPKSPISPSSSQKSAEASPNHRVHQQKILKQKTFTALHSSPTKKSNMESLIGDFFEEIDFDAIYDPAG